MAVVSIVSLLPLFPPQVATRARHEGMKTLTPVSRQGNWLQGTNSGGKASSRRSHFIYKVPSVKPNRSNHCLRPACDTAACTLLRYGCPTCRREAVHILIHRAKSVIPDGFPLPGAYMALVLSVTCDCVGPL